MLVTAESLTDEQISESGLDAETIEHAIAVDPNWPGGARYWGRRHREARARVAAAINARAEQDAADAEYERVAERQRKAKSDGRAVAEPAFAADTVCGVPERGSLCMTPANQCTRHARAKGV